jgi:hypothetical protein
MSSQPATPPTSHYPDQTSQETSPPRRTAQQLMMDEINLEMKQPELERQAIDKTYKRMELERWLTTYL